MEARQREVQASVPRRPSGGSEGGVDTAAVAHALQAELAPWLRDQIHRNVHSALLEARDRESLRRERELDEPHSRGASKVPTAEDIGRAVEAALQRAVLHAAAQRAAEEDARASASVPPPPLDRQAVMSEGASEALVKVKAGAGLMEKQLERAKQALAFEADAHSTHTHEGAESPLPVLMNRKPDRKGTMRSETSNWTNATSAGAQTHEEANRKALVINFRRLSTVRSRLDVIHMVLRAAALALLAVFAVRGPMRLAWDISFLLLGLPVYALHEAKYALLDVAHFARLAGLLGNDGEDALLESPSPGRLRNPNRCLQALSYQKAGKRCRLAFGLLTLMGAGCIAAWAGVVATWTSREPWWQQAGLMHPDAFDLQHYATLLLLGSVMFICHVLFEVMYWRETKYFMPEKDGKPWDIDTDGIPGGNLNRLLGLPSVWFSTRAAYDDIRVWVTLASGDHRHKGGEEGKPKTRPHDRTEDAFRGVSVEELALYALTDPARAARLRSCLLNAKLYDKTTRRFMRRLLAGEYNSRNRPTVTVTGVGEDGSEAFLMADIRRGERPAELGVELLFYDNRSGEVWVPRIPEDMEADMPVRLKKENSYKDFLDDMLK